MKLDGPGMYLDGVRGDSRDHVEFVLFDGRGLARE